MKNTNISVYSKLTVRIYNVVNIKKYEKFPNIKHRTWRNLLKNGTLILTQIQYLIALFFNKSQIHTWS